MASKKKPNKKAAKPAKKAVKKPAPKKAAKKPAKKMAPKKAVKKPVKKAVAKKPVKKVAPKKAVAKKAVKKVVPKKVVAKKAVKPVKAVAKPVAKKAEVKPAKAEVKPISKPEVKKTETKPARSENKRPEPRNQAQSILRKVVDVKSLPKPPVPTVKPLTMLLNKTKATLHTKAGKVDERTRYSDDELKEFKEIILSKLAEARKDLEMLRSSLTHTSDNGTDDTSPTFKMMEDGSETLSREETAQLAGRQEKFILSLEAALIRIENKTYGVCRVTGRLINKERLKLVPHTTLSIEAKNLQN